MDVYSLVATNIRSKGHSAPMDAKAEDRHYRDKVVLPRLSPGLLGSIVATTCAILILVGMTPT
ncbi:hypothetical protein LJR234_001112 [Mesorhizobium amorphae]|uniref:hypothetical protein n=1 Tax=Mesorhizobium amorphae TaxID=71433 RepID=UPI003ECE5224